MTNLAEGLPQQQQRVRDLMAVYRSIGNAGVFALMMMEQAMQRADKAAAEGDVVAMIRSYEELKGFE
jgi:hypothetical protein